MTGVVHRMRMRGMAICGVREFDQGKPRAVMTTLTKFTTCGRCREIIAAHRAKAKAAFTALAGGHS